MYSETTRVVFSTLLSVEPNLTTPSLSSAMAAMPVKTTGSSETHGQPPGEMRVTSRSLLFKAKASVESK